jgi:hypothetical protein
MRNTCKILVKKPEENNPLGRYRYGVLKKDSAPFI